MFYDSNNVDIQNLENSFTELFALLKRYDQLNGTITLAYHSNELIMMYEHIDNAIDSLLINLEDFGILAKLIISEYSYKIPFNKGIYGFISSISNLLEVLVALRDDASSVLRERGIMEY